MAPGPSRWLRFATIPERRQLVYVPALESLLREARRRPPLIAAILGRVEAEPLDSQSPQTQLVAGQPVPIAPLTRLLDAPDDAGGIWIRADPIGLVTDLAAV